MGKSLADSSFGILENREDAQECVNDTYLRTWNSIPPTRPQFFFAYLAKICRFLCFDVLDHKNAQKRSALVVELRMKCSSAFQIHAMKIRCRGNRSDRI